MKDRFDLENEIMKLHSFIEDIDSVSNLLMDSENLDDDLSDMASNALNGISVLMKLHAEKMLDTVSQIFKLDQYRD